MESEGVALHDMMTGIKAWNQRVPLPQDFTGDNNFRFPLTPTVADDVTQAYIHGAIGLAINGVPIFVPYKQNVCSSAYVLSDGSCTLTEDGTSSVYDSFDTYLVNELDECGGHSGRGDDYHYHTYSIV